jgi:uncharacterized membrane protein
MRWFLLAAAVLLPGAVDAHGFGRLYNLPVPFWLYAWGAAAALAVSFVIVGFFVATPGAASAPASRDLTHARWVAALRRARVRQILQSASVFVLLLSIATGFFGSRDPYRNFGMTAFWIVFTLAFAYLTALIGNLYAAINPWRVLADFLERFWRGFSRGRVRYPAALGDWPALAFYVAFIWIELFAHNTPRSLAAHLTAYTLLNFGGVWLVGAAAWFRHCEFFGVFLRLVGLMAPFEYRPAATSGARGTLHWRWPFAGLVQERPGHITTAVFALFMLASTAFDGLRMTQSWVWLFWRDPTGIVTALAGSQPIYAYATLRPWYVAWETLCLLASPFLYFAVYVLFVALAKACARSERPLRELVLDFGYTLLPIALVYHVTHYATLILTQGLKIVSLLSDPFGWGWNLLGTARLLRAPILPDMGLVWHTQVGLILLGHIVSVYVAHLVALRVFPTRSRAVLSQLPMLLLMVAFTVFGLWILAQPLTAMTMQ